jgi:hypothetical protein
VSQSSRDRNGADDGSQSGADRYFISPHVTRTVSPYRPYRPASFRNKAYLLELTKKPKQHFLCIDRLVKTELPRFIGVRHDIVFEIKNRFSEGPGGGVLE